MDRQKGLRLSFQFTRSRRRMFYKCMCAGDRIALYTILVLLVAPFFAPSDKEEVKRFAKELIVKSLEYEKREASKGNEEDFKAAEEKNGSFR